MGDAHGFAFWRGRGRVHNLLPVQKRGQGAGAVTGMSFLR